MLLLCYEVQEHINNIERPSAMLRIKVRLYAAKYVYLRVA